MQARKKGRRKGRESLVPEAARKGKASQGVETVQHGQSVLTFTPDEP